MRRTLLIVDDAPFIRELLRQLLEKSHYDVVAEACDGEEAVKLALRKKPDVVIMDLVLPKKSGLEATKEILAQRPNTQIIACTTLDQPHLVAEALRAGCVGYIQKPFDSVSLLETLMKAQTSQGAKEL